MAVIWNSACHRNRYPPWSVAHAVRSPGSARLLLQLVPACDKLHTTRSILADLRTIDPAVWDRFTISDPNAQLWYYQSLSDSYRGRVNPGLSSEFDRTVRDIETETARSTAPVSS